MGDRYLGMSDSAPPFPKTPTPGAGELPPGGGLWGLDLWNGSAWFSDWLYRRLQWPAEVRRIRLEDLRPNLAAGAWEVLLLQIRRHLELQTPLDAEIQVQLNDGHIEWWRMQGSAERNPGGQPVRLAGSVRDISAERRRLAADSQPAA
jgi:PAS domain-containing protein